MSSLCIKRAQAFLLWTYYPVKQDTTMGKLLMLAGAALFVIGLLITFSSKLPFQVGRLPGDIVIRGKHSTFYFPVMTCLLLSLLFSVISWFLRRR